MATSAYSVEAWKTKLDIGMLAASTGRPYHYVKAASELAIAVADVAENAALDPTSPMLTSF